MGFIYPNLVPGTDEWLDWRIRARRLMVTLNGDGVPHAWAPAEGEVLQ